MREGEERRGAIPTHSQSDSMVLMKGGGETAETIGKLCSSSSTHRMAEEEQASKLYLCRQASYLECNKLARAYLPI